MTFRPPDHLPNALAIRTVRAHHVIVEASDQRDVVFRADVGCDEGVRQLNGLLLIGFEGQRDDLQSEPLAVFD